MKPAFTLIEQLAAIALASLFMLAALAVLAGIARDRAARPDRQTHQTISRAADLIAQDLSESRRAVFGNGHVRLSGFGSLDHRSLSPTHRPARVEYTIVRAGETSQLVRWETDLDILSNRNSWTQTVCVDVAGIEIRSLSKPPKPTTRPANDLFGPSDGSQTPEIVELTITPTSSETTVRRVICLK